MPKRENEYWASRKENLRYCSKHKSYHRADLKCQLCFEEELAFRHKKVEPPQLRICTNCNKISLFWNTSINMYECLNPPCGKKITQTEFESTVEIESDQDQEPTQKLIGHHARQASIFDKLRRSQQDQRKI